MKPQSNGASDKRKRPARGLTFEERKARAAELARTEGALPKRTRDTLEMRATCDGSEAMRGFHAPKRKWDLPHERHAMLPRKKICPKCGGNHLAISCDHRQ